MVIFKNTYKYQLKRIEEKIKLMMELYPIFVIDLRYTERYIVDYVKPKTKYSYTTLKRVQFVQLMNYDDAYNVGFRCVSNVDGDGPPKSKFIIGIGNIYIDATDAEPQ